MCLLSWPHTPGSLTQDLPKPLPSHWLSFRDNEGKMQNSYAFSVNNFPHSHIVTDPNASLFFKSAPLTAAGT